MQPGSEREVVLHALRGEINRCAAIMDGGAARFGHIVHAAPKALKPGGRSSAEFAEELRVAALRGAEAAARHDADSSPSVWIPNDLAGEISRLQDPRGQLTGTAFVVGYLHRLDPDELLSAMRHAADQNTDRLLFSNVHFPPAIRATAFGLTGVEDAAAPLASAVAAAQQPYFWLPDEEKGLLGITTQDWGQNIENLTWTVPYPKGDKTDDKMGATALINMIRNAPGLRNTAFISLLGASGSSRPLAPNLAADVNELRFTQGLLRAQTCYAVYSGGEQPRQLMITDWQGLAKRVSADNGSMVDHVVLLKPVSGGGYVGELTSRGRISEIAVPPGDAFPIGGIDPALLLNRLKNRERHDAPRTGLRTIANVVRGVTHRTRGRGKRGQRR